MISFHEHFIKAIDFIGDNRCLMDCHLVDFITEDLWTKCLPDSLREELEDTQLTLGGRRCRKQHFNELIMANPKLADFIEHANTLSLKKRYCPPVLSEITTFMVDKNDRKNHSNFTGNFMSDKKQHEIEVLAKLIGSLTEKNGTNLVIDAGAGKGYLSTSISEQYSIPVLAIDSSKSHKNSAIRRQEMIQKKKHQKTTLIQYSINHIDENMDYEQLIGYHFPDRSERGNCILTGLHTCGQLAHSMIKSFLNTELIKCLCVVPCCYHLTEEFLTGKCSLTKNARMLAQQSVERTLSKEEQPYPPSLFYRSLLQIILRSLGIPDSRIGRGAPTNGFHTYVNWALTKIGVDRKKIPSAEYLMKMYEDHSHIEWKFNVFQSIRVHLGSVVEAAIVLDRVVYLEKGDRCSKVELIQLFDPLISPRCYAIVALK